VRFKVFVRLARTPRARDGFKVEASTNPNPQPLKIGSYGSETALHTLRFALVVDVPDEMLKPAGWPVIEVALPEDLVEQLPVEVTPVAP
jgi:hypothetical protein